IDRGAELFAPSTATILHEHERLLGQTRPFRLVRGINREPLLHLDTPVGVEPNAPAIFDKGVDANLWELNHQPPARQHGEDAPLDCQSRPAEALLLRRAHIAAREERCAERGVTILRRGPVTHERILLSDACAARQSGDTQSNLCNNAPHVRQARYSPGCRPFVVKNVPNRLRITPPNAFSRTNRPAEKTVSAMRSI